MPDCIAIPAKINLKRFKMKNNDLSDPLYLAKALINCPSETPNDAGAIAL